MKGGGGGATLFSTINSSICSLPEIFLIPTIPPCTIFVPIMSNINQPLSTCCNFIPEYIPSTYAQTTTTGLGFKYQRNLHSIVPHVSYILYLVLQQYTTYARYTRGKCGTYVVSTEAVKNLFCTLTKMNFP